MVATERVEADASDLRGLAHGEHAEQFKVGPKFDLSNS